MKTVGNLRKSLVDFWWITKGQLYSMRTQWSWYVILLTISPLSYLFFLSFFADLSDPSVALFVVTGSVASSTVTAAMLGLGQTISGLRAANVLEVYATLPISKLAFVMALTARGVAFSAPSAFIVLLVGSISLGLPLLPALLPTVIVYVLGAFSLAGLGAIIGFYSPTPDAASLATQVVAPLVTLFAPVFMPMERLPFFLQVTSRFIPTTYVAAALREALTQPFSPLYWSSVVVITLFGVLGLAASVYKADWRVTASEAR